MGTQARSTKAVAFAFLVAAAWLGTWLVLGPRSSGPGEALSPRSTATATANLPKDPNLATVPAAPKLAQRTELDGAIGTSVISSAEPATGALPPSLPTDTEWAIAGRVMRDGAPVAGARVRLDVVEGPRKGKRGGTETASDGSFRIAVVDTEVLRLRISERGAPNNRISSRTYSVAAPDDSTYDLSSATVRILVQAGGGPVEGAKLKISVGDGGVTVMSDLDPVQVEVPPLSTIRIRAIHPNGQSVEETVASPGMGQATDVLLSMQIVERPRLIVTVPGATAAGVERLPLRFMGAKDSGDVEFVALPMDQLDTFLVAVVPLNEGKYKVMLDPRSSKGTQRFLTPQMVRLDLPKEGDARLEFLLLIGGRCDVKVSSPLQDTYSARVRLIDESGDTRMDNHVVFIQSEEGGTSQMAIPMSAFDLEPDNSPSASDWAKSRGVVPPGRYTLKVTSKEHETWTQEVDVAAGEATKVKVRLEPR